MSNIEQRWGTLAERPAIFLITLLIIEATGAFETSMVLVAIPTMAEEFQVDLLTMSWVVTTFLVTGAASAAIGGRLGDQFGRKRVLLVLLAASLVGSLLGALFGGNFAILLLARGLQGTSAAVLPLLIGLARETSDRRRLPTVVAVTGAAAVLATSMGALTSGILVDLGDWKLIFWVSSVLALLGLIAGTVVLRETPRAQNAARLNVVGGLLFAPGIAAILLGITFAARDGFTGSATAYLIGGSAILALWANREWRADIPMINVRALLTRAVGFPQIAMSLLAVGGFATAALALPILMQSPSELPVGLGLSATFTGAVVAGAGLAAFALSPIAGRVALRWGGRSALVVSTCLLLGGFVILLFWYSNVVLVVVAGALVLTGVAWAVGALPNVIVEAVPAENTSEIIGVNMLLRTVFTAIGTPVAALILNSSTVPGTRAPTQTAWVSLTAWVLVMSVLALCVILALPKRAARDVAAGESPEGALAM
ncbi:MFS transporter [Nocardia sp. NPDC058176]|uniref:MFS transporter n=1 Tax=Nocardia sp. NPDC058176 TaxID=3346368 RepID=UPI0036DE8C65